MTSFHTFREVSHLAYDRSRGGVETGIREFIRLHIRLVPGSVVLVGSRPSVGRTTFLMHLFRNIHETSGEPQCFISNEDSREEIFLRMASILTGQRHTSWSKKKAEELPASHSLFSSDRDVILSKRLSWEELKADIETVIRETGIRVFYIDKFQGLFSSDRFNNRDQELGYIIRDIRNFATDHGLIFCIASSLSRSVERREGKEPLLSDLRDTGSLEEFCDMVMLVHRPEIYGITLDELGRSLVNYAEVILAKNRFGPTGRMKFAFNPLVPRFEEFVKYNEYDFTARFDQVTQPKKKDEHDNEIPF